jgi:hypothetical protein
MKIASVFVAMLLLPALSAAQETLPTLTLEEALRLAHERSPAIRRAEADADAVGLGCIGRDGRRGALAAPTNEVGNGIADGR